MYKLFLFNTLSNIKEEFNPIDPLLIKMYVCGPTVYDLAHLGNARSVVVYDLLYRILCFLYCKEHIKYVRNITDVDDKINIRAKELGVPIQELTKKTIFDFHKDMEYINCLNPNVEPKVTENISTIIDFIQILINRGYAYISSNHIYFSVNKDVNYGSICGRNLRDMIAGSRVEIDSNKHNPGDFILWKPADKDDDPSSIFESPWGLGRPGWHIECSAMSYKYLGIDFDIHGGGIDLIFPHHANEIAQSTSAFDNSKYAKFWVHNGFLKVNGEKMSKSLGNFITIRDLKNRKIPGEVIRYSLLNTHYKKPLDFNDNLLQESYKNLNFLYKTLLMNKVYVLNESQNLNFINEVDGDFILSLLDDLNISEAFSSLLKLAKEANKETNFSNKKILINKLKFSANLIGLLENSPEEWFHDMKIDIVLLEKLLKERKEAKQRQDWKLADKIREDIWGLGIIIEDQKDGSIFWSNNKF